MACVLIWLSIVCLSADVGSVPSLMARRNVGGVSRFKPSAGAIIAKMLSDAPTGVPPYVALIWLIRVVYCASPVVSKVFCWAAKYGALSGSAASYAATIAAMTVCTSVGLYQRC